MKTKKSFSYVWMVVPLAILSSPLTALSPAYALPAEVPDQPCGTLKNPSPGTLCYTITPGGGKASAGGSPREFSTIIQATEPEYVIASVVLEVTSATGDKSGPTVEQISPGGVVSVVSVATNKLRELKQIKGELQAKATVLSGPALIEAQAKLSALSEEERTFEEVVTKTIAAGQDAGKFRVFGSASPRKCGALNLDKCGSWIEYNIYVVRRYVGDPIAAYNKPFAIAQDAQKTIAILIAENKQAPAPIPEIKTDAAKAGAMSDIVQSCAWTWRRADDSIVATKVRFIGDKQIIGYSSSNERGWEIQNGELVFLGQTGEALTIFDKAGFRKANLILFGHYTAGVNTVTTLTCEDF